MAWIASSVLVLWLAAVVCVRRVLSRRWRGTRFVVLEWRRWTGSEWIVALLVVVALIGVVGGTLLAALGSQLGPRLSPGWPWAVPGLALVIGGVAVMVWSQLAMGESWRVGTDRDESIELVTGGPYRWVRNPIYTSMIGVAAGICVLVPAVGTVVGVAAIIALAEVQVRIVEEPLLLERHGSAYAGWVGATGRFLPRWLSMVTLPRRPGETLSPISRA
jgi:protein-S-isoprenylcysteine O-methyltransferase Ste14